LRCNNEVLFIEIEGAANARQEVHLHKYELIYFVKLTNDDLRFLHSSTEYKLHFHFLKTEKSFLASIAWMYFSIMHVYIYTNLMQSFG